MRIIRARAGAVAFLFAGTLLAGFARGQEAPGASQDVLGRVKAWVGEYELRLQDFLCTQRVKRYSGSAGARPNWRPLEEQELEVSYQQHKVRYGRLKVNGKTDNLLERVKNRDFVPNGEFAAIAWPFDPKASAQFQLDHRESIAGRDLCVFRFRVSRKKTNLMMSVLASPLKAMLQPSAIGGMPAPDNSPVDEVSVGYQGFIDADCETAVVQRVRIATDDGAAAFGDERSRPIAVGAELDIRYEPAMIGAVQYMLPSQATLTGLLDKTRTRVEIRFMDYRKYSADATITFDGEDVRR